MLLAVQYIKDSLPAIFLTAHATLKDIFVKQLCLPIAVFLKVLYKAAVLMACIPLNLH